jgi:hypothetical protein
MQNFKNNKTIHHFFSSPGVPNAGKLTFNTPSPNPAYLHKDVGLVSAKQPRNCADLPPRIKQDKPDIRGHKCTTPVMDFAIIFRVEWEQAKW